jgi:solute carrier family 25 folate transporter 32
MIPQEPWQNSNESKISQHQHLRSYASRKVPLPIPRSLAILSTSPMKLQSNSNNSSNSNMNNSISKNSSNKINNNNNAMIEMTEPEQSLVLIAKGHTDMLASLLAGFGSGALSSIACAPLDLIRTRMQVMGDLKSKSAGSANSSANVSILKGIRDIIKSEGIHGCFRGLGPTLMTVPTFWGLYFPLYDHLKKDLHRRGVGSDNSNNKSNNNIIDGTDLDRVPPLVHMSAAILAGTCADFFCNPMFVVRTRMQTESLHYMEATIEERKPHGIVQTVKGLYKEGGILIFWRGFSASLLGLSHVAIQFPTYEFFKAEARERSETNEESALDLLFASGISKMVATSLTYPHEVVRSRMMDQRGGQGQQRSLRQTFTRIVKNEGFGALYTGIHVSLVRVVPNCCITFMTYEMILRWTKARL